jgi:hypothetical protein
MDDQILQELKTINSLSVNTALWVFRRSFDNFYHSVSELPLAQIDEWVASLKNQDLERDWICQRQMKYPHIFIYGILWYYKYETLREGIYQRESSENVPIPISTKNFDKHISISEKITRYVLPLPFYEGVAFLGELIGTWMLTCPEVIIRSETNIERVGKWQGGRETADWEVPPDWINQIYSSNSRGNTKNEMQLLFTLDFLLHSAFDDYDMGNTL